MRKSAAVCLGLLLSAATAVAAQQYLITTVAGGAVWPLTPVPATGVSLSITGSVATGAEGSIYFSAANSVLKVDASGILTRVAGNSAEPGYSGDGGAATSARLSRPTDLALDGSGNLYIADTNNNVIRRVAAATGIITTVAGNGTPGYAGDQGPATSAQLQKPGGVAVDASGNLYIADGGNQVIRKVAATTGTITTVAGNGMLGYSGDGGPATSAQLYGPNYITVDDSGNLYLSDFSHSVVRKVTAATGIIATVAGNGTSGYAGDGGPAVSAQLDDPAGMAVDHAGNLYIADWSNRVVRRVAAATGIITTVAGGSTSGYAGDGGPATRATLGGPSGVALDASGNLYIAENFVGNVIRKVTATTGIITTVVGSGGPPLPGPYNSIQAAAVDAAGNIYFVDGNNNVIRKVAAATGAITTVAGNGTLGTTGDGGPATSARLFRPGAVAVDGSGNLYISCLNYVIRKVTAATGIISTVAGNGTRGYSGDGGAARLAQIGSSISLAVDASGNLYIADGLYNVVRKVPTAAPFDIITTVAGNGTRGNSGDGGPATSAQLNAPAGVALDGSGNIYISDSGNNLIRKVAAATGIVTTVAGNGTRGDSGDGGPATSAQLSGPAGVAVDGSGNIVIADGGARVREVGPTGIIATAAGNGFWGYSGDGGPATNAEFAQLSNVATDAARNVYIVDVGNDAIRLLVPVSTHAVLSVASTHPADFTRGQTGASYSILVDNTAGAGATIRAVTVTETLPTGLALVSMSGTGWNCSGNICTRADALNPDASYPPITVVVNAAVDAPEQVTNQVTVSGGGSVAIGAADLTTIGGLPAPPVLASPSNSATAVLTAPTVTWNAAPDATTYDVYFGTLSAPPLVATTTGTSYAPPPLTPGGTYYWQIVARNDIGSAPSETWSFTTGVPPIGSRFVPVTPCRVADTRRPAGTFGGPTMAAGATRSFAIPQSECGIPATAQAYSLNVTVVPDDSLSYLTLWPSGQAQPFVSTLNSAGGLVVANAAIVPAGNGGAVSVYVTNQTDVILDIDGYFDSNGSSFYTAAPCRVADTRGPTGEFGGPSMFGWQTRDFPIPDGPCAIPATATAYSLNVTAVPDARSLAYLTTWQTGQARPDVSTLNSWTAKVVANAAIVPAGTNGSVSAFVTDPADVILDINGYFGPSTGRSPLSFYPIAPCRVVDTRTPASGSILNAGTTRSFAIPASSCYVPSTAAAYSVNITAVPSGRLYYLTAWPTGAPQPLVSTLNSWDGAAVANAAIVPAGTNGAISIFVTGVTNIVLDINGYFAP